jgi:hypothetical protein
MAGLVELLGEKLVKGTETVSTADAVKGKVAIGLYFSVGACLRTRAARCCAIVLRNHAATREH